MHLASEVHLLISLPVCGRAVQGAQKPGGAAQGKPPDVYGLSSFTCTFYMLSH